MSVCLVARYCPTEDIYLIPPSWDLNDVIIRRHNIYYKNKNVTDVVQHHHLYTDYKEPADVYVDDDMKSFFENEEDLISLD